MKRIFVDMDGVLCDLNTRYLEYKATKQLHPFSHDGFFLSLDPIVDALDTYKALESMYEVWILTRPSVMNPNSYLEKRLWVEKHLGLNRCERLILAPNKSLLIGEYLIDDNIHDGFIGEHIHFGTDRFPDWKTVFKYLNKEN